MSRRRLLFLLIALMVAVVTAVIVRSWIGSQRQEQAVAEKSRVMAPSAVQILVAAKALPAGKLLVAEDMRWQAWPAEGVVESYVKQAEGADKEYLGAVVRQSISVGEPITTARVVKPGERGFLAAIVNEGMRAISVPVNATTGVSGLFFPGDRVDVILTHALGGGDRDTQRHASETVLHDVRVLAVDQRTEDIDGKPSVGKTATLEVSPKDAEIITMLSEIGRLSLSLRSLSKSDQDIATEHKEPKTYTLDSEVSVLIGPARAPQPQVIQVAPDKAAASAPAPAVAKAPTIDTVSIVRGSKVQELSFSQGRRSLAQASSGPPRPLGAEAKEGGTAMKKGETEAAGASAGGAASSTENSEQDAGAAQ